MTKEDIANMYKNPLVKFCDMKVEMATEAKETISLHVEKQCQSKVPDFEEAAKTIKMTMDKKFGQYWHCVIGEGFAFDVTHQLKHVMLIYFNEKTGCLLYKS